MKVLFLLLCLFTLLISPGTGYASGTFILQGNITTLGGEPAQDAEIYLYGTKNTRRPADFISPKTGPEGTYRMIWPTGTYWAVARIKKGERFGPLMPGDRHSGEPVQIVTDGEPQVNRDFVVADMQELAQKREKSRGDLLTLSGRVTDPSGNGVAGAYVYARTGRITATLPDYVSSWTDLSGRYHLKLPAGHYFLGSATAFPPPEPAVPPTEIELAPGKLPVAIDLQIQLQ